MTDAQAAAVAAQHFPLALLLGSERLQGGVSAQVFRIDLRLDDGSDQSVVLRAMGKSGLESAQEFALLTALHDAGLPTPQPIHLDTSCRHVDAPYVLMDFIEGSSEIPEEIVGSRLTLMADALATIHRVPTAMLPQLPLRLDPVPELVGFLPDGDDWNALRDDCAKLRSSPYAGSPVLLHGDFWPRNLIWRDGGIAAILDWEDAALGDPLSDVACAQLELSYLFDDVLVDQFLSACRLHMTIDPHRLALWQMYVAAAAQRYMGAWGLEPSREAHMRRKAVTRIRAAAAVLRVGALPRG